MNSKARAHTYILNCQHYIIHMLKVQVVNHGVSTSLLDEFRKEIESFFKLPYEEKKKLWQQPNNHEDFGQLFVVGFRLGEGRLVRQHREE